jgi:hypothetical protein
MVKDVMRKLAGDAKVIDQVAIVISQDLLARVLKKDPSEWKLDDEILRDFLPVFGNTVMEGLDRGGMPADLKEW